MSYGVKLIVGYIFYTVLAGGYLQSSGKYRVKYIADYQLNPVRHVEETFYSDEFTVTEN